MRALGKLGVIIVGGLIQWPRDGDDRKAWCATVHWVDKSQT